MHRIKRRILSLVLTFCLLTGLTTVHLSADDTFTITYMTNAGVEMGTIEYTVGDPDNALPETSDFGTLFGAFLTRAKEKGSVAVPNTTIWYTDADFMQPATFPTGVAGESYTLYCKFTTGLSLDSVTNGAENKSYSTVKGPVQPFFHVSSSNTNARNDQYDATSSVFEKQVDGAWIEVDDSYFTDYDGNKWPNMIYFSNVSDSGTYRLKYLRYTATDNDGNVLFYDTVYDIPGTTYAVNITPVPLTITGVQAVSRPADGSNAVQLTGGTLEGVLFGDDVSFSLGTGTLTDANPGTQKAVATNIQLTGSKAGNYTLTQPTDITVDITEPSSYTLVRPNGSGVVPDFWAAPSDEGSTEAPSAPSTEKGNPSMGGRSY